MTQAAYRTPTPALIVRDHKGKPFYEAKWRHNGAQIGRRVGPAWLVRDAGTGEWVKRRGRVQPGYFDRSMATVEADAIVKRFVSGAEAAEAAERERREHGPTFREVAHAYLQWLERVRGAKPSTLADHRLILAEPGDSHKRGSGTYRGHIMCAIGDKPAAKVTDRDIEMLLDAIAATGASPRTVNKHRAVVSAIFNYGMPSKRFDLPANPAHAADKRPEPDRPVLAYYSVEDVEAVARALADEDRGEDVGAADGRQDAEIIRVAAYAGLRMGELLALRWRDVEFAKEQIIVSRAVSAGVETTTKSGKIRRVPMVPPAAAALDRVSRREDGKGRPIFTGPDDLVFCNVIGRTIDGSALRRRYRRAQTAAGVRPLRFHDLRHTFGSLLAADNVSLIEIQAAMGHSALATTQRYLHARPASVMAERFGRAFRGSTATPEAITTA